MCLIRVKTSLVEAVIYERVLCCVMLITVITGVWRIGTKKRNRRDVGRDGSRINGILRNGGRSGECGAICSSAQIYADIIFHEQTALFDQ